MDADYAISFFAGGCILFGFVLGFIWGRGE